MNILIWILVAGFIFASGTGIGIRWERGQEAIRQQEAAEAAREKRIADEKAIDAAAVGHEADKRGLRTEFVVITERIEDAKQTDFYAPDAPACLDDRGVRIVNDAARGSAQAASQPSRAVPGSAADAQRGSVGGP